MKNTTQLTFTPVINAVAYTSGDVLFDTTELTFASEFSGQRCVIHSVSVIDADDQKASITLHFFDSNVSLGTINEAPSITDANALRWQTAVNVGVSNYYDLGGVAVAQNVYQGAFFQTLAPNSSSIFVAGVVNGTPTYTVGGLRIRLGVLWL